MSIVIALRLVKSVTKDGNFLKMEPVSILSVLFEMKTQMNALFVNQDIIMYGTDLLRTATLQSSQPLMEDLNTTSIHFQIPTFENVRKERNTSIETILESVILVIMDLLDNLTVLNARLLTGVLLFIVALVTMVLNLHYLFINAL